MSPTASKIVHGIGNAHDWLDRKEYLMYGCDISMEKLNMAHEMRVTDSRSI